MANTLSRAVEETKAMARKDNIAYPLAAHKVLQSMGFQKPKGVTVRVARIVNDIAANESHTLLQAVMEKCARDSGWKRLWNRAASRATRTSTRRPVRSASFHRIEVQGELAFS